MRRRWTATVTGSATHPDSGTDISTWAWVDVTTINSVKALPTVKAPSGSPDARITGLTQGTHKFRLVATDEHGFSGYRDLTITVTPLRRPGPEIGRWRARFARMASPREVVHRWLDPETRDTGLERTANAALVALILANVAAVILESVQAIDAPLRAAFAAFEWFSVAVFTVEYLLRVWSVTADPRYAHPITGRLRFMLTPGAIVDLVAIVPAYLPTGLDLRFARIVRLGRMMRILKIGRYSRPLRTFARVFHARRDDLVLVSALLLVLLVVSSSAMYFLENRAQPEAFSSIPASMWWAVSTLTTVGYGDIYPVTPLGKVVGSFLAMLGIGFFALPAGILAGAFARELRPQKAAEAAACPHCGKPIPG